MKTKYLLITAIIFLTAIVYLQINLHDQTQKELIEKFKTEQEITARHFAEEVETFLHEETDRIKSFVLFQRLQHGKMSEIKTLVDEDFEYFKEDHVKSINVYDKSGTIIYSTNKEAIGGNNAESKFFKWTTAPENKTEPFINSDNTENKNRSPQMPVFSLLIAMPVYQNVEKAEKVKSTQSLIGVVTIIIDLEETLTNLLPRISTDIKKENVMILDNHGTLWFQTEHPEMVMKNIYVHDKSCFQCHISFDYLGKMLSEKQGRFDYGLKKGPRKIASFSSFEFKNIAWTVVLNHEYSEVTRFLDQSYMQLLIIIGSIIFTLLGFTIISFRSNRLRIRAQEEATLWREKLELEEKIRESEEHYRTVVDNSSDAIIIHCEGRIVFVNPAAIELTGASSLHDLIGKPVIEFVHPDEREFISKHILEILKNEKPSSWLEERYIRIDGSIINVEAISTSTTFNGKPSLQVIIHDITERKKAEEAFRESEARYKELSKQLEAILDHIPGLVFYKDTKNNFIRVNKYLALAHGKEKEELEGKNLSDFYPEEDATKYQQDDLEVINSGIAKLNIEETWQTAEGLKWVNTSKIPFAGDNGEFIGIIGMSIDITERKRAEETISNERLLLRTLIDNVPDSIYSKDLACRKTLVNLTELRFMGVKSESEVLGKDDFDFYPKELAERFFADDQSVMQSEMPVLNREEYILDENGLKRWLLTSKLPLRDIDGRIIGLVGIGRDITERKQAEQEIKHKNEELQKLNSEKDKFFSIIAHDLRGPFSGFLGLTLVMAEELPSLTMAQVQELAISMKNSATNLYSLLENLLQWARMQQGAIPFTPEVVQLKLLIDECIAITLETARNKGIDISYNIQEITAVFVDRNMLQTVIRNLVSNAIKFTTRGGAIDIFAEISNDENVVISVKDTGIGMSREMVDNLFRPDVRTSRPGTENEPSTGLGLMLCKEFTEKNGGKIWVESEVGKGSVFYFSVPYQDQRDLVES